MAGEEEMQREMMTVRSEVDLWCKFNTYSSQIELDTQQVRSYILQASLSISLSRPPWRSTVRPPGTMVDQSLRPPTTTTCNWWLTPSLSFGTSILRLLIIYYLTCALTSFDNSSYFLPLFIVWNVHRWPFQTINNGKKLNYLLCQLEKSCVW